MNLYTGLLHLHNIMRWVILILLLVAIFKAFTGMNTRKAYDKSDLKVSLFLMVSAHITLLIGLYQWVAGPWGLRNIQAIGFGEVMKNGIHRFWAVEHLAGMLIAIILITIGRGVGKKNLPDKTKHKRAFWFFIIALFIILLTVPWPFREGVGRPLLPGQHEAI